MFNTVWWMRSRVFSRTSVLIAFSLVSVAGASGVHAKFDGSGSAAFVQQGRKVGPSGASGVTAFGVSVALSANGGTAIAGGYAREKYTGGAWVLTRSGSRWRSNGTFLVPKDAREGDRIGEEVAVSPDGRVALLGGLGAWVFTRDGSNWSQRGSRLSPSGARRFLARGVALSADGSTAVIGGLVDAGDPAAAWVFARSGSEWIESQPLTLPENAFSSARDVALSADGKIAVVLGFRHTGDFPDGVNEARAGAAWVYERSGSSFARVAELVPPEGYSLVQSVAISADGRTILIGSNARAWFYVLRPAGWGFHSTATSPSGRPGSNFGEAVALSGDGSVALIGGHHYLERADRTRAAPNVGAVWAFARVGQSWREVRPRLRADDFRGPATFGDSVALDASGRIAAIGGPSDGGDRSGLAHRGRGAVWFFVRQDGARASG